MPWGQPRWRRGARSRELATSRRVRKGAAAANHVVGAGRALAALTKDLRLVGTMVRFGWGSRNEDVGNDRAAKCALARAAEQGAAGDLPRARAPARARPPLHAADAAARGRLLLARAPAARRPAGAGAAPPRRAAPRGGPGRAPPTRRA